MGWFRRTPGSGGDAVRAALAGVFGTGGARTAGAGVYLAERTVLTCAHVVNDALGRGPFRHEHPGDAALEVAFPCADPAARHPARLTVWVPPRDEAGGPVPAGAREWAGDLALLKLQGPPPSSVRPPAWEAMAEGQRVRAWYGGGQRFSYADGEVGTCDGRIGYFDGALSGAAVGPGYSGGPLWCPKLGAVVGLVAGQVSPAEGAFRAGHVVRRGWAVPWQAVRAELERGGAAHLLPAPAPPAAPGGPAPGAGHRLLPALTALLGDPGRRADRARALAVHCGLGTPGDGSVPGVEEIAAVLAEEPRALATLTELLAPVTGPQGRPHLDQLLAVGRLLRPQWLLSHGEHRRLLELLRQLAGSDPALLPRAVRGALPYLELPGPLRAPHLGADAVEAAVAALEEFPGDSTPVPTGSPRVPALLRVAEYLAAVAGEPFRAGLREWTGDVACRLGIHDSALHERRADADAWARRARAGRRTRLTVRLRRQSGDPQDTFRCALWRARGDGSAARVSIGEDRPRTAAEIARLVRDEATAGADGSPEVPVVEFVVDRADLHLPVDEWDGADPGEADPDDVLALLGGAQALGEDYHVVLRSHGLRRAPGEAAWPRRWAERGRCAPLVVDASYPDARAVLAELKTTHRDCGHVVVHGPPALRAQLVEVCVAMGVPVVLWDRAASGHEHAAHLAAVEPDKAVDGLPERVRCHRAKAAAHPLDHPARPALVWEDADRPVPGELTLADPGGAGG
ncbi:hypothetical protein GCM10027168_38990 [Streptomyces capparidis]